jgi:mannose-1-phosphate guanylyltransferase/mannose-6-phosphate isomerase
MAGGSGTRLWPLSRAGYPKQFLVLHGNESLLQQAARRLMALAVEGGGACRKSGGTRLEVAPPLVVGNEAHRFLILDQLREAGCTPAALMLEPAGRNTAPAVTLAALQATQRGADPVLVITPADQTVTNPAAFTAALERAVQEAAQGAVVILGVTPDRPETGYGYIQGGDLAPPDAAQNPGGPSAAPDLPLKARPVQRFVEKPDAATAAAYLAEGGYFWNGGIFVLRASTWLQALERFRPDILAATRAAFEARSTDALFVRPDQAAFEAVPAESVDYAVLERCPGSGVDIRMVPLDAGWNDLGAWDAVWQVAPQDAQGNAATGDVLLHDSQRTLVHATHRLVGVIGLQDVVVVETADAVLVSDRARSQEVKALVGTPGRQHRFPTGWGDLNYHGWGEFDCH